MAEKVPTCSLKNHQTVDVPQRSDAGLQAAQDLITVMLDAEDNAEAGQTTVAPVVVSAATSEAESEERRRKLLQQAEELKKKQEELGEVLLMRLNDDDDDDDVTYQHVAYAFL